MKREPTTPPGTRRTAAPSGNESGGSGSEVTHVLEALQVSHWFGGRDTKAKRHKVLEDVSFSVPKRQFVAMVGPSGCGKTTLLNMAAGIVSPTAGHVEIFDAPVAGPDRRLGYMFARDGLLPWRTARGNVELGMELRAVPKSERRARSGELLRLIGLESSAHVYPAQLSQGMRQRVAIARTLATEPDLILLDEPFAALDAQTRMTLHGEFTRMWEGLGNTVLLVTHDLGEAVSLADRVVMFSRSPGRIVADMEMPFGRPRDMEALKYDPRVSSITGDLWKQMKNA